MIRRASFVLIVAAAAAWFFLLRPPLLGGSTTYVIVAGHSMEPTFYTGDLVVLRRAHGYRRGEIVAYRVGGGTVIHRIVAGDPRRGFVTRGDNRPYSDLWRPRPHAIDGTVWFRIPKLGFVVNRLRRPDALALLVGLFVFVTILRPRPRPRARAAETTVR